MCVTLQMLVQRAHHEMTSPFYTRLGREELTYLIKWVPECVPELLLCGDRQLNRLLELGCCQIVIIKSSPTSLRPLTFDYDAFSLLARYLPNLTTLILDSVRLVALPAYCFQVQHLVIKKCHSATFGRIRVDYHHKASRRLMSIAIDDMSPVCLPDQFVLPHLRQYSHSVLKTGYRDHISSECLSQMEVLQQLKPEHFYDLIHHPTQLFDEDGQMALNGYDFLQDDWQSDADDTKPVVSHPPTFASLNELSLTANTAADYALLKCIDLSYECPRLTSLTLTIAQRHRCVTLTYGLPSTLTELTLDRCLLVIDQTQSKILRCPAELKRLTFKDQPNTIKNHTFDEVLVWMTSGLKELQYLCLDNCDLVRAPVLAHLPQLQTLVLKMHGLGKPAWTLVCPPNLTTLDISNIWHDITIESASALQTLYISEWRQKPPQFLNTRSVTSPSITTNIWHLLAGAGISIVGNGTATAPFTVTSSTCIDQSSDLNLFVRDARQLKTVVFGSDVYFANRLELPDTPHCVNVHLDLNYYDQRAVMGSQIPSPAFCQSICKHGLRKFIMVSNLPFSQWLPSSSSPYLRTLYVYATRQQSQVTAECDPNRDAISVLLHYVRAPYKFHQQPVAPSRVARQALLEAGVDFTGTIPMTNLQTWLAEEEAELKMGL